MKQGALKFYDINSDLYADNCILSITELEENYIALCSEEIIKIYFYNGEEYDHYMTIDENEKYLSFLLYTTDKKLLVHTEEYIKIYNINLKDNQYKLLQTINIGTYFCKPIELSNGDIATADGSKLIILEKIRDNTKLYQIKSISKIINTYIEFIIECNEKEICVSSGHGELIAFINKKTLKSHSFKHQVNGGLGVLCMVNKEIMLIINKQGEGITFIDVPKRKIILNYIIEDKIEIYHYAIKLSDNHLLIACQEEWMKREKHPFWRYKFIPYKDPTKIKLKHFHYDCEYNKLEELESLEVNHYELLNVLIYAKNKHIITNSTEIISNSPLHNLNGFTTPKIYEFTLDKDTEAKDFYSQVEKIENRINFEQFKEILKNISIKYEMEECPEEIAKGMFEGKEKISFKFFKKIIFDSLWKVKFDYTYEDND